MRVHATLTALKETRSEPLDPVLEAYLVHVDRSLIERNLLLSVEERFRQLMELQRLAEELRRGGARAAGS